LRVPWIVGGDEHCANILPIKYLAIIYVNIAILQVRLFLCEIASLVENIAGGSYDSIVFIGFLVDTGEVILANAKSDANHADLNPVVGTGHIG